MSRLWSGPSLRLLQLFEAVVQERSFGGASRRIRISQSAVSQGVLRLEAMLGAELFERGSKGSTPSELGRILLVRTERLFKQIEGALVEPLVGPPFVESQRAAITARRITDSHIRALAAIAQSGSIERASHHLGISQPAIQRSARDLESVLRRPLFNRTARGLIASRSGAELARRLQLSVRELDYARDEIEAARGSSVARLSIGALPLSGTALLAAAINDLTAEFPSARIVVLDAVYDLLLEHLRSGRIDILVGVLRRPDWADDVHEIPLFHDPYAIVVRPSHPLAGRKGVTIDDLARYEWLAPAEGAPRRRSIEALFAQSGRNVTISVETSSLGTQKALLAISDRITLLTRHEAEFEARKGLLALVEFEHLMPRRPDGLATRKDWKPTAVQSRFIELMKAHADEIGRAAAIRLDAPRRKSEPAAKPNIPAREQSGTGA